MFKCGNVEQKVLEMHSSNIKLAVFVLFSTSSFYDSQFEFTFDRKKFLSGSLSFQLFLFYFCFYWLRNKTKLFFLIDGSSFVSSFYLFFAEFDYLHFLHLVGLTFIYSSVFVSFFFTSPFYSEFFFFFAGHWSQLALISL